MKGKQFATLVLPFLFSILLIPAEPIFRPQVARAAAGFVQSCSHDAGWEITDTITCVFGSPVASGDTIACGIFWQSTTITLASVTDGANIYTIGVDAPQGNDATGSSAYAVNGSSSPTTITVTFSSASNIVHIVACHEISGTAASPLDGHNGQYQILPGQGTDAISSGSFTPTTDGDYIFGIMVDTNAQNDTTNSGTNYAPRVSGSYLTLLSEDRVQPTAAPTSATFTDTGTGTGFPDPITLAMAFKPSTGGAGPPWSGIIDPSRAMDWKNVGMGGQNYGNVPHYTTICATFGTAGQASTFAQSATAAQVNAPVSTCPNQSVVFLNAGTYTFSSAMQILNKNGVVFRGAGPNKTIVKFTGSSGCNQGPNSHVCIQGSFLYSGGPPANLTTWTGGFALGATVVTLGSVAGLSPGQMIVLDQQNDTVDSGGVFECDTRDDLVTTQGPRGVNPGTLVGCDGGGNGPTGAGRLVGNISYSQMQFVKVVSISGLNVTIDTPLYMPNWNNAKPHGAWWGNFTIQNSGIEDMTLDHQADTNPTTGAIFGIEISDAYNCWVKNVRSIIANRAHVRFEDAAHSVVRDNYFYGTLNLQSQSYGVESYESSDNLIINNIFHHVASGNLYNGNVGTVDAYNYGIDDANNFPTFALSSTQFHAAGEDMTLSEGNQGVSITSDVKHGTHNFNTTFRNFLIGPDAAAPSKTSNTMVVDLQSFSRFYNIIGNVFGKAGYANTYQVATGGSTSNCNTAIYNLGFPNDECSSDGASPPAVPADPLVSSTLMRWGNWDVVNNASRFVSGEVPSGLSQFANPVPANNNLPTSFFLVSGGVPYSNPPTWWATAYGTPAWPAIGPDVTGGTVTSGSGTGSNLGGHVYLIPAALCQQNLAQDSTNYPSTVIKAYDAATCYPSESATAPDSP